MNRNEEFSQGRGFVWDKGFHADHDPNLEYHMHEPDPPKTLFHVAPKSARASIEREGLEPQGRTWNTGGFMTGQWDEDSEWLHNEDGPYEYRPEGVYMFGNRQSADEYNHDGQGDVYEINTKDHDHEIARDPHQAYDWDYVSPENRAWVTRRVRPGAFRRLT